MLCVCPEKAIIHLILAISIHTHTHAEIKKVEKTCYYVTVLIWVSVM
jgi:hypothetical protein